MEKINCIFCERENKQVVIEENGYKARKCTNCGLIYISPRLSFYEARNLYTNDSISAEGHIHAAFKKRLWAKHNIGIIKKFIKNGSMLEIGAGAGYFLDEARRAGFEVFGTEFNSIKANFIRNKLNIPCEESPLNDSIFNRKKFNIIYHCDVISHFYDPINEFKKINNKLKDDGILVFETGNLPEVEEKYYKYYKKFGLPQHLFFFGENNLKELLKRSGFKLIKIYKYSTLPQFIFFKLIKKVLAFIKPKKRKNIVVKHNKDEIPSNNISNSNFKKLVINAYSYLLYFFRYKIGYLAPKEGRPQTIIVIAQKRNIK